MRPRAPTDWSARPERGSAFFVRLGLWLVFRLGWRFGRVLLVPITAWFYATSADGRAASAEYLARVRGRPVGAWPVLRHLHAFAGSILDAPFLRTGRTAGFRIEVAGLHQLRRVLDQGAGCVLLGSHLGNFEVLRLVGQDAPVPVRPVMYRRNAGVMSAELDRLDPSWRERLIEIGAPESLLLAREALGRNEIVAILADRDPTGGRTVAMPFLGATAQLPAGPMRLAMMLGAPVLWCQAVATGPRRYTVTFAPFELGPLPGRGDREAALRAAIGRFTALVEAGCRAHPFQWFNFFSFWKGAEDAIDPPAGAARAAVPRAAGDRRDAA